jgi:hypothetical protein
MRQQRADLQESPAVPALDCVHRTAHHGRDLVECQLFAVMHDQYGAMVGMQRFHDCRQFTRQFGVLEKLRWERLRVLDRVGESQVVICVVERGKCRGAALFYVIERGVPCDGEEPGLPRPAFLEALDVLPSLEERVLHDVLDVVIGLDVLAHEVEYRPRVPFHELLEGSIVAVLAGFGQFRVGFRRVFRGHGVLMVAWKSGRVETAYFEPF